MNSKTTKGKYRVGNVHLTTTISMSLVLFLIGLVLLLIFAARDISINIKENISISLVLNENISDENTQRIKQYLQHAKYVKSFDYISKEDALQEHIRTMGEDPEKFLGYNPLMASFEVKLHAAYANRDSVELFESKLKIYEDISRIAYQKDIVTLVNDNIKRISFILLIIATVLMLISMTLLNNTIRVSIYSNRFLINTMKLVGATSWFIRKPYVKRGIISGLIASFIAIIMLGIILLYIRNNTDINLLTLAFSTLAQTALAIVFTGVTLTALSSYFAVGKYLRMQTNEIYLA